jgi:hypothetical protein
MIFRASRVNMSGTFVPYSFDRRYLATTTGVVVFIFLSTLCPIRNSNSGNPQNNAQHRISVHAKKKGNDQKYTDNIQGSTYEMKHFRGST